MEQICIVSCTEKKVRYSHSSGNTQFILTLSFQYKNNYFLLGSVEIHFFSPFAFIPFARSNSTCKLDNTVGLLFFYLLGWNFWRVLSFAPWFMDNLNLWDDHAPPLLAQTWFLKIVWMPHTFHQEVKYPLMEVDPPVLAFMLMSFIISVTEVPTLLQSSEAWWMVYSTVH